MKKIRSLVLLTVLVYKNMWVGRSKLTLCALVFAGLVSTLQCYVQVIGFAPSLGSLAIACGIIAWGILFPFAICIVDCQMRPKRIDKLATNMSL